MNVEDMVVLEKIERLAFQAGAGLRGAVQAELKATEVKVEPHPLLARLAQLGRDYPGNVGVALYGLDASRNITWEEIVALGKELA